MDILSSMAGLSGYKAVIKAAELLPKIFPMTITAAGSIKPVKVVVFDRFLISISSFANAFIIINLLLSLFEAFSFIDISFGGDKNLII